jgi:hypothetical protein
VSHFLVLRRRTRFWRYRGHQVSFSCFTLPVSFSTVPRASSPVFMFCAPKLIFDEIVFVGSYFNVLSSLTRFRRYRGRQVQFSCCVLPESFSTIKRRQFPFSYFALSDSFWRYRGHQVSFSCFTLPVSFSTVPRASSPIFLFCSLEHIFDGTVCIRSLFHVLRSRTHFQRYQRRRVPFSCFALPKSFSTLPRTSGAVFIFCAPELVFDDTEGVGSRVHFLRSRTHFRRFRGRRVQFSCFVLSKSFSTKPWALGTVFMFHAPEFIFTGTEGTGSRFNVLRSRTHFNRYRGPRVPYSCFSLPESFSEVPRATGPVFMFCAPRLFLGGTEIVGSRFHVWCTRTRFRRFRGRRVQF